MPNVYEEVKDPTQVRTMTDLVKVIENELGWCPAWDDPRPVWKVRSIEVSKMKSSIKRLEREKHWLKGKFTVENLLIAVEFLKHEKEPVSSPAGVVFAVERALDWHDASQVSDLELDEEQVRAEMHRASDLSAPERDSWLRQLTRAQGEAKRDVIEDWRTR